MDLENQKRVMSLTEQYGKDQIVVLLGGADGEASGLIAETVINGDPAFAGVLTGVQLGLPVYHIFEDAIKGLVDAQVYDDQVSMMEMVLEVDEIAKEVSTYREQYSKF